MFWLNHMSLQAILLLVLLPICLRELAWMLPWMAFGAGGMIGPLLMSESLTHMLTPKHLLFPPRTWSMREQETLDVWAKSARGGESIICPYRIVSYWRYGKQASVFYKWLTSLLSNKRETTYSTTMNWLRCMITFLLRSAVQCIHGAHSAFHRPDFGIHVDYVMSFLTFQN